MITNRRAFGDAEWAGLGRLASEFFEDLVEDYAKHGKAFVQQLRTDHPQTYMNALLLLSPLDATMQAEAYGVVTPEERRAFFQIFLQQEKQAAAPPASEP